LKRATAPTPRIPPPNHRHRPSPPAPPRTWHNALERGDVVELPRQRAQRRVGQTKLQEAKGSQDEVHRRRDQHPHDRRLRLVKVGEEGGVGDVWEGRRPALHAFCAAGGARGRFAVPAHISHTQKTHRHKHTGNRTILMIQPESSMNLRIRRPNQRLQKTSQKFL
jgi:hypothetical protein